MRSSKFMRPPSECSFQNTSRQVEIYTRRLPHRGNYLGGELCRAKLAFIMALVIRDGFNNVLEFAMRSRGIPQNVRRHSERKRLTSQPSSATLADSASEATSFSRSVVNPTEFSPLMRYNTRGKPGPSQTTTRTPAVDSQ